MAGISIAAVKSLKPPFDETALAQLGAAVVLLWKDLPEQTREHLLGAAEVVGGIRSVTDVRNRLEAVIARHTNMELGS